MDAESDEIGSRADDLAARKRAIVGRLIEAGGLSYSKIAELLELSPHAVAELAEEVRAKEADGRDDLPLSEGATLGESAVAFADNAGWDEWEGAGEGRASAATRSAGRGQARAGQSKKAIRGSKVNARPVEKTRAVIFDARWQSWIFAGPPLSGPAKNRSREDHE